MNETTSSVGGSVGVYGKIAEQGDFLRANAGPFSLAGMDGWFQAGVEVLHKEATTLARERTAFLLAPETTSTMFMGSFVPSTDSVGRSFPLIVFSEIPGASHIEELVALPRAYHRFFDAAGTLAEAGTNLSAADLVARAQTLMPSHDSAATDPSDWMAAHSTELASALGGSPRAMAYAMRTFVTACDQASKLDPSGRGGVIVVDAPAPTPATRTMWLDCARRRLPAATKRLSAFWTDGAAGRLLLSLGAPPAALLSYLANPRHRASRFWPLRTEVASALDQAEKNLSVDQRRLVWTPTVALGDLASAFCRAG